MALKPAMMEMLTAAVADLAWPIAIVVIALLYKPGIAALIDPLVKRRD